MVRAQHDNVHVYVYYIELYENMQAIGNRITAKATAANYN